jgi:hypothetical protein
MIVSSRLIDNLPQVDLVAVIVVNMLLATIIFRQIFYQSDMLLELIV